MTGRLSYNRFGNERVKYTIALTTPSEKSGAVSLWASRSNGVFWFTAAATALTKHGPCSYPWYVGKWQDPFKGRGGGKDLDPSPFLTISTEEDPKAPDGASIDQVFDIFKNCVQSEEANWELGGGLRTSPCIYQDPRYTCNALPWTDR